MWLAVAWLAVHIGYHEQLLWGFEVRGYLQLIQWVNAEFPVPLQLVCGGKPDTKSTFHRHLFVPEDVDVSLDSFTVFVACLVDAIQENLLTQNIQRV